MFASRIPLLVVVGTIVVLAVTRNLFSSSPIVIAIQVAAVALSIWARRSFPKGTFRVVATPEGSSVIRTGPYRLLRHPMYSASLLFIWTAILSHRSVFTLVLGLVVTSIVVARVVVEERLLRSRYADYTEYARSTKALVPFIV